MSPATFRIVQRGPAWRDGDGSGLTDLPALLDGGHIRLLKKGDVGRRVGMVRLGGRDVVVKRFDESRLRHRLVRFFTGAAAARASAGAAVMRAAGQPAPGVIAVLATAGFSSAVASCLVAELVAGERADRLWHRLRGRSRRLLLIALAERLRAMHGAGVYPQDVGLVNWIVRSGAARHDCEPVLVDLDRVRHYSQLSQTRKIKNLVQIAMSCGPASLAEKLLFLRRYTGDADRARLRALAAEIERGVERKRQRNPARWGAHEPPSPGNTSDQE